MSSVETWVSDRCENLYRKISFSELLDSLLYLHGQKIELEGYYHEAFETSALAKRENYDSEKVLWIDFDYNLFRIQGSDTVYLLNSPDAIHSLNYRRIKLRGIVDAKSHGHLGAYSGTIKEICYMEVMN